MSTPRQAAEAVTVAKGSLSNEGFGCTAALLVHPLARLRLCLCQDTLQLAQAWQPLSIGIFWLFNIALEPRHISVPACAQLSLPGPSSNLLDGCL